jgi:mono/diheme cytochrome c family protein
VSRIDCALVRRRTSIGLAVVLAAVGLLAAACGGKIVSPLPTKVVGTLPTVQKVVLPAAYKGGDATAGKQVFLTAGCTGCHTLKDAGATGTVGPNLDQVQPPATTVFARVTEGRGAMPSFKGKLTTKQIADVIAYVTKATGGNANG